MMRPARQGWAALALLSLALAGCRHQASPDFPAWAETPVTVIPQQGSSNGFDGLALAARSIENTIPASRIDRTSFTPGMRTKTISEASDEINSVAVALNKKVEFDFTPRKPFESAPYHRGWRMIGRALAWRIAENCAIGNFDPAVRDTILAHRLGFALTGGSVTDASLGLAIVSDARMAIAPHLSELGAGQLNTLSTGIANAVSKRPSTEQTIENERRNMALAVQYVQDSYQAGNYESLKQQLGPDVKDAIKFLKELHRDDSTDRPQYFQGFAAEAETIAKWLVGQSVKPVSKRSEEPHMSDYRPWRRFAKHFFTAGEPYLASLDATLARTRLLAIEAGVLAQVKAKRVAPATLDGFAHDLTQDPYSGQTFVYRASGPDFVLYSVGADLRDDGGQTDEAFAVPDVVLEK